MHNRHYGYPGVASSHAEISKNVANNFLKQKLQISALKFLNTNKYKGVCNVKSKAKRCDTK